MTITWEKHWNTGIATIDAQHQRIAQHINHLGKAILRTQPSEPIAHNAEELAHYDSLFSALSTDGFAYALDAFIECLEVHFAFEESLHQNDRYVLAAADKQAHDLFLQRIKKYREQFKRDEAVSAKLHRIVEQWLENHIANDLHYIAATKPHSATLVTDTIHKKKLDWLLRPFAARSKNSGE